MSMSKSAASDQVKTQALEFLRDLQRSGMLESMVSSVQQEAAQMPIGAMTDGAKRRCPESGGRISTCGIIRRDASFSSRF